MTAETDIAAIDDGGANTAAEVRTALTSVLGRADLGSLPTPSAKGDIAVYDGTAWVVVSSGANDQVLTADSAETAGVKWATPSGGGGGGDVPAWVTNLAVRPDPAHADDDEFDDDSLSGDWTALTVSGSHVISESLGLLSVSYQNQSSSDLNGIVKALTPTTPPVTVETVMRMHDLGDNYYICGLVFSDGVTAVDNIAAFTMNGNVVDYVRNGTFTAAGGPVGGTLGLDAAIWPLYMRLIWKSANTFAAAWSPDGVSWTDAGISDQSLTLSPTHVGLVWSRWGGGTEPGIVSFEYLRVAEGDLSV